MRIDLHVHSSASDGVFSPAEVVRKAHANGVEVMALTDHDTVSGLKEARKEAEKLGMRFIDGVELSVSWGGRTIHVVSLGSKKFEPYRELSEKLSKQRDLRARTIASKFDAMGIYNTYEQALELAGNGLNLSRRHFALALVQRGTVGTEDEAFEKYLRDEGPAFVKTQWMTLPEAMRFIRETEGVAVVAHPGRYIFAAPLTTIDLLEEFKALGAMRLKSQRAVTLKLKMSATQGLLKYGLFSEHRTVTFTAETRPVRSRPSGTVAGFITHSLRFIERPLTMHFLYDLAVYAIPLIFTRRLTEKVGDQGTRTLTYHRVRWRSNQLS